MERNGAVRELRLWGPKVGLKQLLGGCQGLSCWDRGQVGSLCGYMSGIPCVPAAPHQALHGHWDRGAALLAKSPLCPTGRARNYTASLVSLAAVSTPTRRHCLSALSPQDCPRLPVASL